MENDTIQTEVISPIVLHTAVETGIQFVREDYKKRSAVKVKNGRKTVCVYHMNNIPFFQNDYLSWENLNCCGGWKFDDKYLYTAVQNHKKLVVTITVETDSPDKTVVEKTVENWNLDLHECDLFISPDYVKGHKVYWWSVIVARKGTLNDFFDMEEITSAYSLQGLELDREELQEYFSVPLIDLFAHKKKDFDFANPRTVPECVITGLGLGYPLESTVSFIQC